MDRFNLVRESFMKKARPVDTPEGSKMQKYLDAKTFYALLECIEGGKPLDRKTADGVAKGMKEWALEHHVTHVTHWFQPLTEGTAEKHDSLIDYDGQGGVIETFDGKMLAQQEPDASPGTPPPRSSSRTTPSASPRCSSPTPARRWTTRLRSRRP